MKKNDKRWRKAKNFVTFVGALIGFVVGVGEILVIEERKITDHIKQKEKFKTDFNILAYWIKLKQEGSKLQDYFLRNGIHSIAVYGEGPLPPLLCKELEGAEITVIGNARSTEDLRKMFDAVSVPEIIVITETTEFEEKCGELTEFTDIPMVSLEDIIYGI